MRTLALLYAHNRVFSPRGMDAFNLHGSKQTLRPEFSVLLTPACNLIKNVAYRDGFWNNASIYALR